MSFDNIRIVLVAPNHPGNIGAVARAMKTMDLHRLYLVRPAEFPAVDAERRALGAVDILIQATVVDELQEAVGDCQLVIGGTARARSYAHPVVDARQAAKKLYGEASRGIQVAAIFGTERTGLTNDDLNACNFEMRIPTSAEFRSLNLGSAVQLVAYEIFMAAQGDFEPNDLEVEHPDAQTLEYFYQHLTRVLDARGYTTGDKREVALYKLRRLFGRSRPEVGELKMLHSLVKLMEREE